MSYRPHGRAKVDARNPRAFAVCDRCSMLYNRMDLQWQWEWVGAKLQNLQILVCQRCLDKPQEQLRARILPPDPLPVSNPRPENYAAENAGGPASTTNPNFWDGNEYWDGGTLQIWDD